MATTPPRTGIVDQVLRHDSGIVLFCVAVIILGACWYTVAGIGMNMTAIDMTRMAGPVGNPMRMATEVHWTPTYT
ncbi:MAG: DUF2182 domain-containing protein, partial [Ruegeria sp.]|nr:DUF2182 domain-containing protein [Ruegeria sp.]